MPRMETPDARAERIKFLRKQRGLSQDGFAKFLSEGDKAITRGAVGNWERGQGIKAENMRLISKKFSVSFDWLANGEGAPPSSDIASHDFTKQFSDESESIIAAIENPFRNDACVSLPTGTGKTDTMIALVAQRILSRSRAIGIEIEEIERQLQKPLSIRGFFDSINKSDNSKIDIGFLNSIAKPLHTTATWLLTGIGRDTPGIPTEASTIAPQPDRSIDDDVVPSASNLVEAAYGGIVEAGTFREVDEFSDVAPPRAAAIADPEYPYARMVVFDVRGDSMNAYDPPITSKTQITGLDFESLGNRVPMAHGMVVVIERTRDGGHLRELSVKQLEIFEDRYEFHPRSTNPKHKPIVVPHDMGPEDGQSVRLLAWVRQVTQKI